MGRWQRKRERWRKRERDGSVEEWRGPERREREQSEDASGPSEAEIPEGPLVLMGLSCQSIPFAQSPRSSPLPQGRLFCEQQGQMAVLGSQDSPAGFGCCEGC